MENHRLKNFNLKTTNTPSNEGKATFINQIRVDAEITASASLGFNSCVAVSKPNKNTEIEPRTPISVKATVGIITNSKYIIGTTNMHWENVNPKPANRMAR